MKSIEFEATVLPNGTLALPPHVAAWLPRQQTVRVTLVVESQDSTEDAEWERLAAEEFFKGYAPSDAIYDDL